MTTPANDPAGEPGPAAQRSARLPAGLPDPGIACTGQGHLVYGVAVADGEQAATWQILRDAHPRTGLWPFVSELSPDEWLEHDDRCRTADWILRQPASRPVLARLLRAQSEHAAEDGRLAAARGNRPTGRLPDPLDFEGLGARLRPGPVYPQPTPEVWTTDMVRPPLWVCFMEAAAGGYQIPARLSAPYTPNWMASASHRYLTPEDHSAVVEEWHNRYDAVLYYLDSNSIRLAVSRPPSEPDEVARVAVEHYAYCDDLDQTIGEVDDVAKEQVASRSWAFWWD